MFTKTEGYIYQEGDLLEYTDTLGIKRYALVLGPSRAVFDVVEHIILFGRQCIWCTTSFAHDTENPFRVWEKVSSSED